MFFNMADISKLKIPVNNTITTYSIKDSSAITTLSVSGSTITATLRGGSTFSFNVSDTKQGIVSSTTKTYLTGVTTAPTSTLLDLSGVANTSVYATAGLINGHEVRIAEKVKLQYNATTQSLDFIFE